MSQISAPEGKIGAIKGSDGGKKEDKKEREREKKSTSESEGQFSREKEAETVQVMNSMSTRNGRHTLILNMGKGAGVKG